MKLGIIREGKTPPDSRVPLVPKQCREILDSIDGIELAVQPSSGRCFPNANYSTLRIPMQEDLNDCEVLLGVKEVPIDMLIPEKTYFFFSHTIKKQPYNRGLLQAILQKRIRLIDYEVLTNEKGKRLIAFGKFAGMVGAHNGLLTYGKRSGTFQLPRMKDLHDYAEAKSVYSTLKLPAIKIVLTGTGRVGQGAAMVLRDMGIQQVEPDEFLKNQYETAVFTQLRVHHYVERKDGKAFDTKDFYQHPEQFKSAFEPFTKVSDIMVNGIYWDNNAPVFFTKEDTQKEDFSIQVIADVTCDIAPVSSIPCTLKASTIEDPVFGYDPLTGKETQAFQKHTIDMMTIDNLPNELPRDASRAFGAQFIEHILPEFSKKESAILERATIAVNGQLGSHFQYLKDYVEGKTA